MIRESDTCVPDKSEWFKMPILTVESLRPDIYTKGRFNVELNTEEYDIVVLFARELSIEHFWQIELFKFAL